MKRTVFALQIGALVTFAGNALAAISGAPCVECHTMHNSQDNAPMRWDGNADPARALLRAGKCTGCHADGKITNNGSNIIPQVVGTVYGSDTLAGGSFKWVIDGADAKGHNVGEIAAQDKALGLTPPGWDKTHASAVNSDAAWAQQLSCSGQYGCHGDHTVLDTFGAVKGAHHTASSSLDGSTVGKSYRFLRGIAGVEDSDWEFTNNATDHNVYKGVARNHGSSDATDTISHLCAECHGKFHAIEGINALPSTNMSNPWLRHPTDIDMRALSATSEYQQYGKGIGGYSVEAPVALSTPVPSATADYSAEAIVTCISCHRPHGSPNDDLLRWDYAGMKAGSTDAAAVNTGCFRCHTTKDGDAIK